MSAATTMTADGGRQTDAQAVGSASIFHLPTSAVFVFVLLVNLIATSAIAANHLEPFADLATYYQEAQMIAAGRGFTQPIKINVHTRATDAPYPTADRFIFPLVVAGALKLFGDSLAVANVVAAASMALTALPLYLLGRRLFDTRAALLATLLFALNPFYHIIGIQAWTDLTATLLYYSCLLALAWYYFAPAGASALHSGLWFTLAALTREESVLLAIPLVIVWWWRGRNVPHGALFLAAPLIGFGLRALYLFQTFGDPLYTEHAYFWLPRWGLWYYLGAFTPSEYLAYVGGIGGTLSIRLYNLLRFSIDHFSDGVWYFTGVGMMPWTMLAAVAAAHWFPLSREQRRLIRLFAALMLLQVLAGLGFPGYIDNGQAVRHGSFAAPLILLIASAGIIYGWERARATRVVAALVVANYLLFAVAYLGTWGDSLTQPQYRGAIVLAAEWAREHVPPNSVLMTRRAAETYYFSNRYVVVTPSTPFAELMAFAQAHHVTHFVISDVEREGTPNLLQGIKTFPRNFQTAYATEGAQVVAVTSYNFPSAPPLPNELYAGKTVGRPAALFDWNNLLPTGTGHIASALVTSWRDVFTAVTAPPETVVPREQTVNVRAGDSIVLQRYALLNSSITRGDDMRLTLYWRARASTAAAYTVFVHLLDADGVLRAQQDTQPLGGSLPTNLWQADETIEDHYQLSVSDELPTGVYELEIGMYDSRSGGRLPLVDALGQRLADDRLLIQGVSVR